MLNTLKFITSWNSNKIKYTLIQNKSKLGHIEYRYSNDISNITDLYVDKKERNKGHGRKLINYFEENIKNHVNEIKVGCSSESIDFYKKNGYVSDKLYDNDERINIHYHKIFRNDV